jgi:hypothetical protein
MALDLNGLTSSMASIGQSAFKSSWGTTKNFAIPEFKKIAMTLVEIEAGLHSTPPRYSEESAKILFRMQLRAAQMVLTSTVGLELKIVEDGINAALAVVSATVNKAIGFSLIG